MKFGGTSVQDATAMKQVVNIVRSRLDRQPVVVLSAAAGITDTLIRCCQLAHEGKSGEAGKLIADAIVRRHNELITSLIRDTSLRKLTFDRVDGYANEIKNLIDNLTPTSELSAQLLDAIASYGEQFSTAILSAAMEEIGLEAKLIDARHVLITDENYGKATPLMNMSELRAREIILPIIEAGAIPVTQGFIGSTLEGATTTLGRNGSDYSAAIIGSLLQVDAVEIWSDVDGILTADPKLVPEAKLLETVTFQEATEMAHFGAKVLHPNTTIPLLQNGIPVHVYNTKRPQSPGTRVVVGNDRKTQPGRVKTIAYRKNVTVINVHLTRNRLNHRSLNSVVGVFKRFETQIYLTKTSESNISLVVDDFRHIDVIVDELSNFAKVIVEDEKAVICLIGDMTQNAPTIETRALNALRSLETRKASDSASGISLSFVINQSDLEIAAQRLHHEFFEKSTVELSLPAN